MVLWISAALKQKPPDRPNMLRSALGAALDEGVFGLAQLIVHWHLAKSLPAGSYGAFVLAMAGTLLAGSLHNAFIVEPLLVAGASQLAQAPGYLRAVLRLHWAATAPMALLLGLVGWALPGHAGLGPELWGSGALLLGLSYVRLVRGMAYAQLPPWTGTAAVAGYALLVVLGLGLLALSQRTSSSAALWVMGVAGAAVGTLVTLSQRLPAPAPGQTREALAHHWQHGRWLLVASPLRWAVDALPLVILGVCASLAQVALLRAALNLMAPAVQVVGAVRLMLLPRFANAAREGGLGRLLRGSQLTALGLGALLFALVSAAGGRLLLVYGGRYQEGASLLPLLSLIPALLGSALLFENVLRAKGRSELSVGAFAAAALVSAIASALLTPRFAATGAAWALLSGYGTLWLVKGWLALVTLRAPRPG